ncbi:MAG TPA: cell surface protein SprA [Bacteroidales bacterium]|nr:cell surface protein SprA [Bacteroidales bacterium]
MVILISTTPTIAASVFFAQTQSIVQDPNQAPPQAYLPFPVAETYWLSLPPNQSDRLLISDPPNVVTVIEFDPSTGLYVKSRKVGDRIIGRPFFIPFEDFLDYDMDRQLSYYWRQMATRSTFEGREGIIPEIHVGGELFDMVFGGRTIEIRPTGSAELIFGVMTNRREDPSLDEKRRRTTNFDFQQRIQLGVEARIGEKINISTNYNTDATFDFENRMKLEYRGTEDEILQLVEAGDVTLPLPGTLISGTLGLFGFKTQMRFGNTTMTNVFSQQRTESRTMEVQGGAQTTPFEIRADEYEENRHYFLGQYFRNTYDQALSNLPLIRSNINITRIEVWITNIGAATQDNRNIVAFADLGESQPHNQALIGSPSPFPSNTANNLYQDLAQSPIRMLSQATGYLQLRPENFVTAKDFETLENARLLRSNEFTFNPRLGFISLNQSVSPDHVLAVAFQYTIIGDETVYQVGEFSNEVDAPGTLIVKLLKSTAVDTRLPKWDLMMKNVYSLGAFQINPQEFRLNILYDSEELGVRVGFFDEGPAAGQPLIRLMNLDRLNTQHDAVSDGVFDFVDNAATQGGTIQASNGRIYFPVIEPFGSHLRTVLQDQALGDKYAFDSLYTTTRHRAQQFPERNRFIIEGSFRSAAGAEIPLNAINIPEGSVVVTAGGVPLTENVDYTVDYMLGRLRIINEGILNSGVPLNISLESASLFNIQTRTLMGTHINHSINDDFNVGATIMRLSERPLTQKVSFGDEPIANTIWGLNTTYTTETMGLTRLLNRLPFFSSQAPSRVTFDGEFAHLVPGHSRRIGAAGTSYIDDFEGSKSAIDLKNVQTWFIASTPQGQTTPGMFPEAAPGTGFAFRYNAARLAWYIIDPLFTRISNLTPAHIRNDVNQRSNHFVREVLETEIWPNKESPTGIPSPIPIFNLAIYPSERGPYNFDTRPSPFSRGVGHDGLLLDPETRWGGIMRGLHTTDFEAANIEHIEFWLMDPFVYNPNHRGGDLYFNLGSVSEDVLRDGRKAFENGLPVTPEPLNIDTTLWGIVPVIQAVVNAFDNNPASRQFQDVGLNGLSVEQERVFYREQFLEVIASLYGTQSLAYQMAFADPSSSLYHYYRGSNLDAEGMSILERYKRFNNMAGNSPTTEQSPEPYPTTATNLPNNEDINRDGTLNEGERYFQYRVSLRPQDMVIGRNYITDIREASVRLANNQVETIRWFQFKVPLRDPNRQVIGNIRDFRSIRFLRMFLKGFEEPIVCRFATLELVRGTWRTYDRSLLSPGEYVPIENVETSFEVFAVNIEENGQRHPVPYVLPPGIEREIDLGTTALQQRNEQSLSLRLFNLLDGDARAVYKTADIDVRQYRRLRMFTHAEAAGAIQDLEDGEITVFIRLGTDFTSNYYEYEVPLKVTPWGTSALNERGIWPLENEIDIDFSKLQEIKLLRNTLSRDNTSGVTVSVPFSRPDGRNRLTIVGTPTLSSIRVIMVGVRNPRRTFHTPNDDGRPKSAEVWINELRLYDFEDRGGWAATGRINTTLADLGNITVVGFMSTPGFGSLEQKVNQRSMEQLSSYDIASSLEAGRLFPENFGLQIPVHFNISETVSNPQFNPLNPDIPFEQDLKSYATELERDSIRHLAQDYTRRTGINFTNVRKTRTGMEPTRFYSIENFDFTYAFNEVFSRSPEYESDIQRFWRAAVGYNFSPSPSPVTPFANIPLFRHEAFSLIRNFNFFYMPRLVSFRTNIDRNYAESLMRPRSTGMLLIEPNVVKSFTWNRLFDIRYDITRALRLEFSATVNARIDEPEGRILRGNDDYRWKRDSIWQSIRNFGRPTFYNHRIRLTYNIPVNQIPLFNWLNATAEYSGTYDWMAAPQAATEFGNSIENSQTRRLMVNANFIGLYNKFGFLRQVNQRTSARQARQPIRPQMENAPGNNRQPDEAPAEDQPDVLRNVIDGTLTFLMGFRNLTVNFTEGRGTRLPGFTPSPSVLGQDWDLMAPGTGFILGGQQDIRHQAAMEGWITDNPMLNNPFAQNKTQNLTARGLFEPFPNLRIEFTALRNFALSRTEFFKADEFGQFGSFNRLETGSFSISFLALRTTFEPFDRRFNRSPNFQQFRDNRMHIATRLAQNNPNWDNTIDTITGFPSGYGPTSQDVLIASFMAAYAGWDPSGSALNPFLKIPMPNWRLTFDGLTNIPALQRIFQSITISHGYSSTFNIGNFRSNVLFRENSGGHALTRDQITGNFIPRYDMGQVSISEQFNPLINLNITWQNQLLTRIEFRSSRDIMLSLANNQITDISSSELIIGTGYRFRDLAFTIAQGGGRRRVQSDLIVRLDASVRTNRTVLRKLAQNVDLVSAGQQIFTINASADYQVSQRVNLRFFFDRTFTNPFISNQFLNVNSHGGISMRFMLL